MARVLESTSDLLKAMGTQQAALRAMRGTTLLASPCLFFISLAITDDVHQALKKEGYSDALLASLPIIICLILALILFSSVVTTNMELRKLRNKRRQILAAEKLIELSETGKASRIFEEARVQGHLTVNADSIVSHIRISKLIDSVQPQHIHIAGRFFASLILTCPEDYLSEDPSGTSGKEAKQHELIRRSFLECANQIDERTFEGFLLGTGIRHATFPDLVKEIINSISVDQ